MPLIRIYSVYLSLYSQTNAFQGKVHTGKLKASKINGVWLWDADPPQHDKEKPGAKASVLEQLRRRTPQEAGSGRKSRKKKDIGRE